VGDDLFYSILRDLKKCNIDFIIVGGVARLLYGSDMMTSDIDIVVPKKIVECRRLIKFTKKRKYRFRIGNKDFNLKQAIDLFPLRYLKLICRRKRKPLPDIDIFLGKSYDDVDFDDIKYEIIKIGNLQVKVATVGWLTKHKGSRKKDDIGIKNMKKNLKKT